MFKDLEIHNFQSHEDTYLEFCPFVNVILGLSTVGKTSLLRSLRLLTENRPSGAKFFSNFAGDKGQTSISLGLLPKGNVEIRKDIHITKKGKKECDATYYILNDGQGEYNFTGVGESVPDQVRQSLNLSELNFQRQFDALYLVSSDTSAGEVARTINRITNLERVNEWVSVFSSKINESNRNIVALESDIKQIRQDFEKYEDLDEIGGIIAQLTSAQERLEEIERRRAFLGRELAGYEEKILKLKTLREFLKAEKYILKVKKIQDSINRYYVIKRLVTDYDEKKMVIDKKKQQLDEIEPLLSKINEIKIGITMDRRDLLRSLSFRLSSLKTRNQYLEKILPEFSDLQGRIKPVDNKRYLALKGMLETLDILKQRISNGKVRLETAKDLCFQKLVESKNCPGPLHCKLTEIQLKEFKKTL